MPFLLLIWNRPNWLLDASSKRGLLTFQCIRSRERRTFTMAYEMALAKRKNLQRGLLTSGIVLMGFRRHVSRPHKAGGGLLMSFFPHYSKQMLMWSRGRKEKRMGRQKKSSLAPHFILGWIKRICMFWLSVAEIELLYKCQCELKDPAAPSPAPTTSFWLLPDRTDSFQIPGSEWFHCTWGQGAPFSNGHVVILQQLLLVNSAILQAFKVCFLFSLLCMGKDFWGD